MDWYQNGTGGWGGGELKLEKTWEGGAQNLSLQLVDSSGI